MLGMQPASDFLPRPWKSWPVIIQSHEMCSWLQRRNPIIELRGDEKNERYFEWLLALPEKERARRLLRK